MSRFEGHEPSGRTSRPKKTSEVFGDFGSLTGRFPLAARHEASGWETIFARLSQAGDSSTPLIQLCARESDDIHRSFLSNVKLDLEIR